MSNLYRKLCSVPRLRKAWSVVYKNGIASKSAITKKEIEEFSFDSETYLNRIASQLRKYKFRFKPSRGLAIKNPKKPHSKRPIVISPVANKILQRAILDVIQEIPEIAQKLNSKFNYGGVQEIGVPEAIHKAYVTSLEKPYFVRTDISKFFVNVPRAKALNLLTSVIDDIEFNDILVQATNTELDNLAQLGADKELFPLEDSGVAQGSCLSPMLCNLLLHEFDLQMNKWGIVCIRYIDDFILFAPNQTKAFRAFDSAKKILEKMNLSVYDPRVNGDKAEHGVSRKGFEFLGCNIREDRIRPSPKSVARLKERVTTVFNNAIKNLKNPEKAITERNTYRDALYEVSNVIRGWGNTYAFCTDDTLMQNIDVVIDEKIRNFNTQYRRKIRSIDVKNKRRLMGIFLLEDCKKQATAKEGTLRHIVNAEVLRLKQLNNG